MQKDIQEKIDETLAQGKYHYAFKHGVVYWGGFMILFFNLLQPLIRYISDITNSNAKCNCGLGTHFYYYFTSSEWLTNVIISIIFFSIGGFLISLSKWKSFEKKHKKADKNI